MQAQLCMSVYVCGLKWAIFAQDVVIWVRPDWNDKPRAAVLYQRYVVRQTFLLALPWLSPALV